MKLKIFILLTLVTAISADWSSYKRKYKLSFESSDNDVQHEKNFNANLAKIRKHNAKSRVSFKLGLNQFSHLNFEEFSTIYLKTKVPSERDKRAVTTTAKFPSTTKLMTTSTTKSPKTTTTRKPATTTKPQSTTVTNKIPSTTTKTIQSSTSTTTKSPATTKPFPTTTKTKSSETTTAKPSKYPFGSYTEKNAPASVDFRYLMQPVQSQGQCGSCWALSAIRQLEVMMKIKDSNFNTILSSQYLVDCDTTNGACTNGWPTTAMYWIKTTGQNKVPSEIHYPYKASKENCSEAEEKIDVGIQTITQQHNLTDGQLMATLANYGPQVVAIYASSNLQSYASGVLKDSDCFSGSCYQVNHGVLLVGYGTDPVHGDYWLLQNSWSDLWGEKGYFRLARNSKITNMCNIACWPIFSQ